MDILCLNNITIYADIIPPKQIIYKEYFLDNFTFWFSRCKNIYFTSTEKHPIHKYNNSPTFMLSHLFFIVQNQIVPQATQECEIHLINLFLQGCLDYLKVNSSNSFEESQTDPIVGLIYYQNNINVVTNPLMISYVKSRIDNIKFQHTILKKNVSKMIKDFQANFESCSKNILDKIVPISQKSVVTQTEQKSTSETEIQTDVVSVPKNEECIKNTKKKGKKDQEIISFTEDEYAKLIASHKEDIEKTKTESIKNFKEHFINYITKTDLNKKQIYTVLTVSDPTNVCDAITLFLVYFVSKNFRISCISDTGEMMTKVPPFIEFWREIILPNIEKMKHPIFKIINQEWLFFHKIISESGVKVLDFQVNIFFGHIATILITEFWDLQHLIPSFFNILFRRCRNIPLLISLLSGYEEYKKTGNIEIKKNILKDFELLYSVPSSREILMNNLENINYPNEDIRKILILD